MSFQYHPKIGSFDVNTQICINVEDLRIRSDDDIFYNYTFIENGKTYETVIDQYDCTFYCLTPRISSPSHDRIIHAIFDIISPENTLFVFNIFSIER